MSRDPYHLENSAFAKALERSSAPDEEPSDLPEHPLQSDASVATLCAHLEQTERALCHARNPEGAMNDDVYFQFAEGLTLRSEVVVRIVLDFIKQHPSMIITD